MVNGTNHKIYANGLNGLVVSEQTLARLGEANLLNGWNRW